MLFLKHNKLSKQNMLNRIKNWEAWPFEILYAPLAIFWIKYMIQSKAVWFFTPSNPKITFGGLEGEPKKEMYNLLPPALYPPTFTVLPHEQLDAINQKLLLHKITYPFIVKPEVGGQGILLRKINNVEELKHYNSLMPWEYIVQQMVTYPMEVSVFYIRHPQNKTGTITGFLHKIPLHIIGNGKNTLQQLIQQHPKAIKQIDILNKKHAAQWNEVLPAGEKYMLSYAANHNRGAQFINLVKEIDDTLVKLFDTISNEDNQFYYGRYDIMCTNIADFKAGKNFTILEYNGCGAEPNHFYDTGYTLLGAYKEILKHWKALYQISKYNAAKGVKPWAFNTGRKFLAASRQLTVDMKLIDIKIG
jgi:hypothetical protein